MKFITLKSCFGKFVAGSYSIDVHFLLLIFCFFDVELGKKRSGKPDLFIFRFNVSDGYLGSHMFVGSSITSGSDIHKPRSHSPAIIIYELPVAIP